MPRASLIAAGPSLVARPRASLSHGGHPDQSAPSAVTSGLASYFPAQNWATWSFAQNRERTLRAREKLVSKLPVSGEVLRGSLLERTVRHTKGCPKCARGEGHHVFVLTVTYPGGRTRQISVRRERVAEVRRWLSNYQELKGAIEAICELNHDLLRPERTASKARGKRRD